MPVETLAVLALGLAVAWACRWADERRSHEATRRLLERAERERDALAALTFPPHDGRDAILSSRGVDVHLGPGREPLRAVWERRDA